MNGAASKRIAEIVEEIKLDAGPIRRTEITELQFAVIAIKRYLDEIVSGGVPDETSLD